MTRFESCKQKVATKHGFPCWEWLVSNVYWDRLDDLHREVCELYADEEKEEYTRQCSMQSNALIS